MPKLILTAFIIIACCSFPAPAGAAKMRCKSFSGTATGPFKSWAVDDAQQTLKAVIDKWHVAHPISGISNQIADKPNPNPYWRDSISPDLFLPPDVLTNSDHTICWKGVVSPVVCTSGAKLCW